MTNPRAIAAVILAFLPTVVLPASPHGLDLPELIANELVERCFATSAHEVSCPNKEAFSTFLKTVENDQHYNQAIYRNSRLLAVKDHVRNRHSQTKQNVFVANLHTTSTVSIQELEYAQTKRHKSAVYKLASAIRGLVGLHYHPSDASKLELTDDTVALIAQFKSTQNSNTSLFQDALNRNCAATELREIGFQHEFLLEEKQWLCDGTVVSWELPHDELVSVYYDLFEQEPVTQGSNWL